VKCAEFDSFDWRYAGILAWREVSIHFREPLWEASNHYRELLAGEVS